MYFEDIEIPRLVKLIEDTEGYLCWVSEYHEGKVKGIHWRYTVGSFDIGSNNFDKFSNSTIITIGTSCAIHDNYPLKELLTMAFEAALLIDYK